MVPKGLYKLVMVNTASDRAKRLNGRVVEDLKEECTIQHMANCESKSWYLLLGVFERYN